MICRVNSGQEKTLERILSQRCEECTPVVALRDQKKCCLWANAVEAEAYEAYRIVIKNGTKEAMSNRSHTQIFRWWGKLVS